MARLLSWTLLLALAAPLAAQAPTTDGATTFEQVNGGRSIPFYPPLPPNSADLVYDDGNYTGSSRNLQNPGIHAGWPYWAHQVRFTPVAGMTGALLEARYVAAVQWGTATDMDVVIRDAAGLEVASMTGVTAVVDSGNWQIVDVSALGFVPGSSDFCLELRPSNPCAGSNGFTIPFSTTGSNRSAFSSDCNNPFSSYALENRDQFIRAVVSTGPSGPTLQVANLAAGGVATISVTGATPNGLVRHGYSLAGGGPVGTPFGQLLLSPPYKELPRMTADGSGYASLSAPVPPGTTGVSVWLHALDLGSLTFTNGLAEVIG